LGKFESWAKGFEYRVAQGRVQIFQDALSREEAKLEREGGGKFLERYDQLISFSVIGLLFMLLLSWCDSLPLSEEGKQKKRYMYQCTKIQGTPASICEQKKNIRFKLLRLVAIDGS